MQSSLDNILSNSSYTIPVKRCLLAMTWLATGLPLFESSSPGSSPIDFNRDIRPILSENCFQCHGFDEKARKAGLRLDDRDAATKPAKSQAIAIVPGQPENSELIARITTGDGDDLMPPADSGKKLSASQIDLLRRWIAEGAPYARHWAFIPPVAKNADLGMRIAELAKRDPKRAAELERWPVNEIDRFVLARLLAEELQPSPEADAAALNRRLSFDLTGLPPSWFIEPHQSYESHLSSLLASRHFGERMAVDWLDLARYADTNGYFSDLPRQAWLWRDWVIAAFNRNMPFDQFTIEQLAGDLLPDATVPQRIATGFSRNNMANNEGGAIDEEFRVENIVDRLDTTAATWMGLTLGCAQCHDHKYDPISQREYYQIFAFFNNTTDTGHIKDNDPPPVISVPSAEQTAELERLAKARAAAEKAHEPFAIKLKEQITAWEKTAAAKLSPSPASSLAAHFDLDERFTDSSPCGHEARPAGTKVVFQPGILGKSAKFDATQHVEVADPEFDPDKPWSIAVWLKPEGSLSCVLSKAQPAGDKRGIEIIWWKGYLQANLVHRWGVDAIEIATVDQLLPARRWNHAVVSYDGSGKAAGLRFIINGKAAKAKIKRDSLAGSIVNREPLRIGRRDDNLGFYGEMDELRILRREVSEAEAMDWQWSERLRGLLAIPADKRPQAERDRLTAYFAEHHADAASRGSFEKMTAAEKAETDAKALVPTALVMREMPKPRDTFILQRGQYDQHGDAVRPEVPAAISSFPAAAPRNRLGFAKWLVDPANPLTARVVVNRLWKQCFGEGLVRTVNDFGSQGEAPTHPELLDWLAVRFMRSGWDVKEMLRLIVSSRTYRQSSVASANLLERDPENRLLARGPRFRMSAEMIRDQALAASGLLVPKIGGPSAKPYQPPGLWEAVSYNGDETYVPDSGDGLWRRSLYTFIKRQAPPPSLLTFDGPTREKCTVKRARTNTPLQALMLLNDDTYIEAARALAANSLKAGQASSLSKSDNAKHDSAACDEDRIQQIFTQVLSRSPDAAETDLLKSLLAKQRERFANDTHAAKTLAAIGESPIGRELDHRELAAWTVAAQAVLNLDEAITRR